MKRTVNSAVIGCQGGDEGIFSDAEEDETATAFGGESTYTEGNNNASTPGVGSSASNVSPNKDTLSAAKSSPFSGCQGGDEGVFSDAEEDETATAFLLMAARGSARHYK